ncbi:hypothetical protein AVEN_7734-1 [Araneus ventricosus]|uniref:Uncharacterized protein n=1 Tax=Araneus ventricosus TaxID=182803 RepID=A0A4Y2RW21_ARAVE|nr:hypothetical protein AVEN_7734-1 [Araneus ventricosus]
MGKERTHPQIHGKEQIHRQPSRKYDHSKSREPISQNHGKGENSPRTMGQRNLTSNHGRRRKPPQTMGRYDNPSINT